MGRYRLVCPSCGREFAGYTLSCECPTFLRTEYEGALRPRNLPGMWRFLDWLPCDRPLDTKAGPVAYRSDGLGRELGLRNLFVAFTGYWPERGAFNLTGSFKDLEACPTIARARENGVSSLIVASAGNTARAFAHVTNKTDFEVYLAVPESCLYMLWTPEEPSEDKIHLISVRADYCKTGEVASKLSNVLGVHSEGGAKNVARRDGMGTVMLEGALAMKRLPDHYFQAVGSGTGALGCWEMAARLRSHGWRVWPKLHLSQNAPFTPMYNAWRAGRRQILPEDMPDAEKSIAQMYAVVLSNRKPPYSIGGGVYDALVSTNGEMYAVTNEEAKQAGKLFEMVEGIDLLPAAEVAVASLIQAVEQQKVDRDDWILLNVTGGGIERIKEDFGQYRIKPEVTIKNPDIPLECFQLL